MLFLTFEPVSEVIYCSVDDDQYLAVVAVNLIGVSCENKNGNLPYQMGGGGLKAPLLYHINVTPQKTIKEKVADFIFYFPVKGGRKKKLGNPLPPPQTDRVY